MQEISQIVDSYRDLILAAECAKKIVKNFEPTFPSAEAFLAYQDSLNRSGERITYREDGSAEVHWK